MTGTLFVVATPIGNLSDITFRAVDTLKNVDIIAAEDTRVTGRLLKKYSIETQLVSYREQNAAKVVPELIEQLKNGQDVAIVSDAGTPSISDPGGELVVAAHNNSITVSPVPGASALCSTIAVAGLSGEGVRFTGFLPRKGKSRKERIFAIAQDPSVSIIYESPHRLSKTLNDLIDACGSNRMGVIARELTKIYEEIKRAPLKELSEFFTENVKGEIVIAVEGDPDSKQETLTDGELEKIVETEIKKGRSAKDISASLSSALGIRKKRIYNLTLKLIK